MKRDTQTVRILATHARGGFTLVEIVVVIIIIGIMAALIGPRIFSRVGQSKAATATSNAAALSTAVKTYMADYGSLPPSIDALATKPGTSGGYGPYVDNAEQLKDAWGNKFILLVPPKKNADFDIISYGSDGKPGGEGEAADIVKP